MSEASVKRGAGRYVRVVSREETEDGWFGGVRGILVADQTQPWLHGGTFELFTEEAGGAWELLSRSEGHRGSGGGFVRVPPAKFEPAISWSRATSLLPRRL